MIKIISGEFRSRILQSPPDGEITRPFLGRVRESVFGMLQGWFDEEPSVLDLFAGVGTVGLEAISRGARSAVMVEQNKKVYELLEANVQSLGCEDRAVTILGDALGSACLLRAEVPVDLVFVDPPYALMQEPLTRARIIAQIERARDVMRDGGFVILRAPFSAEREDLAIAGFEGPESHRYRGNQWVHLYRNAGGV